MKRRTETLSFSCSSTQLRDILTRIGDFYKKNGFDELRDNQNSEFPVLFFSENANVIKKWKLNAGFAKIVVIVALCLIVGSISLEGNIGGVAVNPSGVVMLAVAALLFLQFMPEGGFVEYYTFEGERPKFLEAKRSYEIDFFLSTKFPIDTCIVSTRIHGDIVEVLLNHSDYGVTFFNAYEVKGFLQHMTRDGCELTSIQLKTDVAS